MRKIAGLKPKRGDLGVKMPEKREKPFFRMSAENGQKGVRNGVLGEETGKTGAETAFFVQVERMLHNADIQYITQKQVFFCTKNLCISFAFANRFANPYMIDYQIVSILILCFCIFARKKCMGGRRAYIYIIINKCIY